MKKIGSLITLLVVVMLAVVGCNQQAVEDKNTQTPDAENNKIAVDTDNDDKVDTMAQQKEGYTEVTVDVDNKEATGEWCVAGTTYTYKSDDGDVSTLVEGLVEYKGSTFCKAQAKNTIKTQQGDINSDSTYYYNQDQSEFWVITTTSGAMMPEPQTNEVHIVDGEVQ